MKRVAVPIRDLNANLQVILNHIKAMKYEKVALRKKKKKSLQLVSREKRLFENSIYHICVILNYKICL